MNANQGYTIKGGKPCPSCGSLKLPEAPCGNMGCSAFRKSPIPPIPEWAREQARPVLARLGIGDILAKKFRDEDVEVVALALVAAEQRGREEIRKTLLDTLYPETRTDNGGPEGPFRYIEWERIFEVIDDSALRGKEGKR